MLVLFETPAGYALFKLLDNSKLQQTENLYRDFEKPETASKIVKLKHFERFNDTTEALAATSSLIEGKLSKPLKKILKKHVDKDIQEQLLVSDAKLGSLIKDKFNLQCMSNTSVQELMRCIRQQLDSLISGVGKKEMTAMALGLAHSLSRYKLKYSPDKVDTMIVQAVCLLDDLDKELNNYIMRCREWYGWHFPELSKIVTDNIAFVKTVKIIGTREHTVTSDLSDILPEELEEKVKEAAEISMGTEISDDDIINIQQLCDQVIEISGYRAQLYDYLKSRMMSMAPNLTVLVGDLVGARLISNAGSLVNLAKHPASTIQILGAEKALFRALKTKKDTPKYGLIYHSQLIGQASVRNKGKMARMLAAKAALATRVDALGEDGSFTLGTKHKATLEIRLRMLEEGNIKRLSGTGKAKAKFEKYHGVSEVRQYQSAADSTLPSGKRKWEEENGDAETSKQKKKKIKKEKLQQDESFGEVKVEPENQDEGSSSFSEKKKKKKVKEESMEQEEHTEEYVTPKKMKIKRETGADEESTHAETPTSEKKKKKKKMKQEDQAEIETAVQETETPVSEKKKKKKKSTSE